MRPFTMNAIRWLPHNLIGHPMMGLLHLFGFEALAIQVHDATLPRAMPGEV